MNLDFWYFVIGKHCIIKVFSIDTYQFAAQKLDISIYQGFSLIYENVKKLTDVLGYH